MEITSPYCDEELTYNQEFLKHSLDKNCWTEGSTDGRVKAGTYSVPFVNHKHGCGKRQHYKHHKNVQLIKNSDIILCQVRYMAFTSNIQNTR